MFNKVTSGNGILGHVGLEQWQVGEPLDAVMTDEGFLKFSLI